MTARRCAVAMSGGVDSSVAAILMQKAGYECVGVTMQLYPYSEEAVQDQRSTEKQTSASSCASKDLERARQNNIQDIADAKAVCERLGMEHYTIDFSELFVEKVIDPFVHLYCGGLTPNPCINCNRDLKFGALIAWAREQGFSCLATGHYAKLLDGKLLKGHDQNKDQSYVLYMLSPEDLAYVELPLGTYTKEEVRALALEFKLDTAEKSESQDICFIPSGNYGDFIEDRLKSTGTEMPKQGAITLSDGTPVGTHRGIHHYTIGQRRGLGVSGPEPLYVLSLEPKSAVVQVGREDECYCQAALIEHTNFLVEPEGLEQETLWAKHRYRGTLHQVSLKKIKGSNNDGDESPWASLCKGSKNAYEVRFLTPQRDLTPGQSLVVYLGEQVIGGGVISATL